MPRVRDSCGTRRCLVVLRGANCNGPPQQVIEIINLSFDQPGTLRTVAARLLVGGRGQLLSTYTWQPVGFRSSTYRTRNRGVGLGKSCDTPASYYMAECCTFPATADAP